MLCGGVFGANFFESGAGLGCERAAGVFLEAGLVGGLGGGAVVQVVQLDVGFGHEGVGAVAAAGVFAAEKFVLADGVAQGLVVVEETALLGEQVGDGEDAGVGLGRGRVVMVDGAEEVEGALVVAFAALVLGAAFERLEGLFGAVVGGGGRGASRGRARRIQAQQERGEKAEPLRPGEGFRRRDLAWEEAHRSSVSNGTRHTVSRAFPPKRHLQYKLAAMAKTRKAAASCDGEPQSKTEEVRQPRILRLQALRDHRSR